MLLTAAAVVAYKRSYSSSSDVHSKASKNPTTPTDGTTALATSDWKGDLLEDLGRCCFSPKEEGEDERVQQRREPPPADPIRSTMNDQQNLMTATSFRHDVRMEWIQAVFGDDLYATTTTTSSSNHTKMGKAKVAPYQAYSIQIQTPKLAPDEKMGMTISRLTLGLYVRTVQPGTEAACAGVLPNSVLVAINGLVLLAEPSKHALERLWQYEGHPTTTTSTTTTLGSTSSMDSSFDLMVEDPVQLDLIHNGKPYSVVFLSNPPFGIDWAPCGNFALVKKSWAYCSRVPIGAIVAQVGDVYMEDLDHVRCAEELRSCFGGDGDSSANQQDDERGKSSETEKRIIPIHLCFPPPETRSGFYERESSSNNKKNSRRGDENNNHDENNSKPKRPMAVAQHDGVEVRVHPIWNPSGSNNIPKTAGSLSKLAYRVASGELYSLPQNRRRQRRRQRHQQSEGVPAMSGRTIHPCPELPSSLLKVWSMEEALLYLFHYHDAHYNEQALKLRGLENGDDEWSILSYLQKKQPLTAATKNNNPNDTLQAFLMHIVNFACQTPQNSSRLISLLCNEEKEPISHSSSLPLHYYFRMELLAQAMDLTELQRALRLRREALREEVERELPPSSSQIIIPPALSMDSSIVSENPSHVSSTEPKATTVTMTTNTPVPPTNNNDSMATAPSKKSSKKLFSFFRKRKSRKKLAAITNNGDNNKRKNKSNPAITPKQHSHRGRTDSSKESTSTRTTNSTETSPEQPPVVSSKSQRRHHKTSGSSIFRETQQQQQQRPILRTPVHSYIISQNDMFSNTLKFLEELPIVCADIEKSLLKSFSQKLAGWALQPWSASKETALAQVTHGMRERLAKYTDLPLKSPIDSCVLNALDTQQCFILPSAHFPLLLTFDVVSPNEADTKKNNHRLGVKNGNNVSSLLMGPEKLYRTTVELVQITSDKTTTSESDDSQPQQAASLAGRRYLMRGSVAGTVMESSRSTRISPRSNRQVWDSGNIFSFDSRSSWGPPQTLSLSLSEVVVDDEGNDQIVSSDQGSGVLSYQRQVGYCWVDLAPIWEQSNNNVGSPQTCQVPVWNKSFDFDQHGELAPGSLEHADRLVVEVRVTTKVVDSPYFCTKRSLLYKHDDDVRQEMVATEFVKSCDNLLKASGLDLQLLTFRSIPVGKQRGFIEWVPGSVPLSEICQGPFSGSGILPRKSNSGGGGAALDGSNKEEDPLSSVAKAGLFKYESLYRMGSADVRRGGGGGDGSSKAHEQNPIQDYLRSFAFDENDPYMIRKSAMERYVKSCAGYCVITYLLGVGDRHLDNMLLHPLGHFFHCDYSFILGNDPKKYQPLRMTQAMVDGMGGPESDNFAMFMSSTCAAFLTFRRPENVRHILAFIRAMEGCGLTADDGDSSNNSHSKQQRGNSMEESLLDIRQRLRLDLSEDDAISYMEGLIHESCSSKLWIAVDAMHSLGKRF